MWRMGNGAGRRGYQPFGSFYGNPYGPSSRNPYGNPYGNSRRNPYEDLQREAYGNPYGSAPRSAPKSAPRGAYDNSRQRAEAVPGWPGFAMNNQQRDGANVARMNGFGKAKAAADDASSSKKDETGQDLENSNDQTAAAPQESTTQAEEAAKAAKEAAQAAEQKSAEEQIIEEAEAVVEDAAKTVAEDETDELAQAKQEAADWQDRYMRLHAEWDTYRRRMTEQRAEEKTRATEKLIEDLLPVLDDFERTVDYATENGESGLLDGVKAVQSKLIDALVKDGLEVLDPVDEPYNALEAQAVATVPDPDVYDETVKDVYQKGYKLGNKVIRPAMVTVTTGGPARPKDETNGDPNTAEQSEAVDE